MNLGDELFQAEFPGQFDNLIDEQGAQAPALEIRRHHHPHIAQVAFPPHLAHVEGDIPDDAAVGFRHQGKDPAIVDVVHPVVDDGRVPHVTAQETQFLGLETLEELQQHLPVFLNQGPQRHPGAVFQYPLFLVSHALVPLW